MLVQQYDDNDVDEYIRNNKVILLLTLINFINNNDMFFDADIFLEWCSSCVLLPNF